VLSITEIALRLKGSSKEVMKTVSISGLARELGRRDVEF